MKVLRFLLLLLGLSMQCPAQDSRNPALLTQLSRLKSDTSAVQALLKLGTLYQNKDADSAFLFLNRAMTLAKKIGDTTGERNSKFALQAYLWSIGDFPDAIKIGLELEKQVKASNDLQHYAVVYAMLLTIYRDAGDYPEALKYAFLGINFPEGEASDLSMAYAMAGSVYYDMGNIDSAAFFLRKALEHPLTLDPGWILMISGRVYSRRDSFEIALNSYRRAEWELKKENNLIDLAQDYNSIGDLYVKMAKTDSAIHYAKLALGISEPRKFRREIIQSYQLMSDAYLKKDIALSYQYFRSASAMKDSVYSQANQRAAISQRFNEQLRQTELDNLNQRNISRNHQFILLFVMSGALIATVFLFRNNRRKQQVNRLLKKQNDQIETAMSELKAAQAQLIQSEKMASLGEVTAGIAHEIQNPLNFVNNFSELNTELMSELKAEQAIAANTALAALVSDMVSNNEKIHHHGKRAETIVKGMLAHSRKVSVEKKPVALNDLCEEALVSSYTTEKLRHPEVEIGLSRSYADNVSTVNVVEADLSRALINLFGNAFYEVIRKTRQSPVPGYKPSVSVRTEMNGSNAEIRISDNGSGIPDGIREKVFQPFFTSKPPGEGTGLGLTQVYETITKLHKGIVRVEQSDHNGTTFLVSIPKGDL